MDGFKLRFIPLGGISDVTMNMYVYELYKNGSLIDILIVDCGIGFPKSTELGVDLVIPDITYLKDKIDKIRGILLTHGHEDHISALGFHYKALGSPPLFASKLTSYLVQNKFKEIKHKINPTIITYNRQYRFGNFIASFIHVTHSIPDATHIFIQTPAGNIYHGADYKFDLTPPYNPPPDFHAIQNTSKEGVMCLMSDCLGAEREGMTLSEKVIGQTFEDLIRTTKGKFIMTTFASNISRIRQCAQAAIKFNRMVCFLGRSMIQNTKTAREIGYMPLPDKFFIDQKEISKINPSKLCLIVAGSQGQFFSALSRLANDQNKYAKVSKLDKVLFSSDPIPGNEEGVDDIINRLYLKGAEVIYPTIQDQLHASGHGNQIDLQLLVRLTNPRYLIPIGGSVRHQRAYTRLVSSLGYNNEYVFTLADGQTVWFEKSRAYKGDTIETRSIYVDAYGVGDVGNIILRDRETIGTEGMVVVVIPLKSNLELLKAPEIISRGFIFEKGNKELFDKAKQKVIRFLEQSQSNKSSKINIEKTVSAKLEKLFFDSTGRKPLVIVQALII